MKFIYLAIALASIPFAVWLLMRNWQALSIGDWIVAVLGALATNAALFVWWRQRKTNNS